jgi:tetratricopeptide (TPR) repeat protein
MRLLNLDKAVNEIVEVCLTPRDRGGGSPFFFITGAGIAHPTVPLASGLESECKDIARKKGGFDEPSTQDPIDRYSHWLEAAFPHAEQRRRYLQEKIHGKAISPGSLRLAHLLHDGQISRLLVTPNFDDFVARALALFGEPAIVCDHPATIRRLTLPSIRPQILHVHGTYWFYDCCNLRGEITQRARGNEPIEALTVSSFLSNLLWHRSPLVVGYSGWEDDVIMTTLKSRLVGQVLPFNIYWFCHERAALKHLPSWLTTHSDVRFVVPDSTASADHSPDAPIGPDVASPGALDAAMVLGKFIQRLKLPSPPLFDNPLTFFAEQMERDIYFDEEPQNDLYRVKTVLAQVKKAAAWIESAEGTGIDGLVKQALDAMRRADSTEVVNTCKKIDLEQLRPDQRDDVAAALMNALKCWGNASPVLQLEGCELALAIADRTQRDGDPSHTSAAVSAHAYFKKGQLLMQTERYKDAVVAFDACIKGATGHHDAPQCAVVADALFCKGLSLNLASLPEEEVKTYRELRRRYRDSVDPHFRQLMARGLANAGMTLHAQDRCDDALPMLREVVEEFGRDTNQGVYEPIAKSLVHIGLILDEQNDQEGAIRAYDDVKNRFDEATDESVRDPLGRALANKGIILHKLGRRVEALEVYGEMLERFGDGTDESLHPVLATVLERQGTLLGLQGHHKDAIGAFDKLIGHFEAAESPDLVASVSLALANKGVALVKLGDSDRAMSCWAAVLDRAKQFGAGSVGSVAIQVAQDGIAKARSR